MHEGGDTERAGFYSPTLECVEETCAAMAAALRARGNEKMKVCVCERVCVCVRERERARERERDVCRYGWGGAR